MDEVTSRRLAHLRAQYARAVRNHGQQSKVAREARTESLVQHIRSEFGGDVRERASRLDVERRAAMAPELRDLAYEFE